MDIRHVEGDRAYYRLSADEIILPKWEQFSSATHYYQTALHEVGHATGHPERIDLLPKNRSTPKVSIAVE